MMLYKMYHKPQTLAGFTAAIETVPQLAWKYYKGTDNELRRREHLWAQDPELAYYYALNILKKRRFPQGEPAIAQAPKFAYWYALNVLRGRRFRLGEPAIAQNPHWALRYVRDVLKRAWPEGEPAIAQKPVYWNHYLERFPERRPKTKTKKQS